MTYEKIVFNEQFNIPKIEILKRINVYMSEYLNSIPRHVLETLPTLVTNYSTIQKWSGVYRGIQLAIIFSREGSRTRWFGITQTNSIWGRYEHNIGYIEVSELKTTSDVPVHVRIVCGWEPFYELFLGLANFLRNPLNPELTRAQTEIFSFRSLVERQTYKDIIIDGKPKENIARAFLQMYLVSRSYHEVGVRGGRSDLLLFEGNGRFLYETKIWKGGKYYLQGIREMEEYISGEGDDSGLNGIFYIVFDPTKTDRARKFIGSDHEQIRIKDYPVEVFVVKLFHPQPSRKQ